MGWVSVPLNLSLFELVVFAQRRRSRALSSCGRQRIQAKILLSLSHSRVGVDRVSDVINPWSVALYPVGIPALTSVLGSSIREVHSAFLVSLTGKPLWSLPLCYLT